MAALVALLKGVCIISGGPGTGKTFAVARILAFLLEQHEPGQLN
jgi:exodeoxyribonuclease V alpha subunit